MKKFAYRFKKLRLENNMTQTDVVDKFNSIYHTTFNKSTISQYENGKRKPDISILENWAEFFDVSIDYLLGHIDIKKYNLDTPNLTDKEQSMLNDYRLLNVNGKNEAEKRVKELTAMPFYRVYEDTTIMAHSNNTIDNNKIYKDLEEILKR